MANKLRVIACGGSGINIAGNVVENVAVLGKGFCDVETTYIDTSRNNIDKIGYKGTDFWMVKTKDFAKDSIAGSGGERKTNSEDITENIKEFLNKHSFNKPATGEYTIVIGSASGGSGSVLSPVIIKSLMERGIPVIAVVIGDTSNGLSAINTLNTLTGLNNIASKIVKKPLSIVYLNNTAMGMANTHEAEAEANKRLFNTLGTLSMFLSGDNGDIDSQDMVNFVDQSNYKTINIKPGLYGLVTYSGEVKLPEFAVPTVGRTLTTEGIAPTIDVTLLHHKTGVCLEDNAMDIYKGQFPIHTLSYANFLSIEAEHLKKVKAEYDNIMKSIQINDIELEDDAEVDDNGLVF